MEYIRRMYRIYGTKYRNVSISWIKVMQVMGRNEYIKQFSHFVTCRNIDPSQMFVYYIPTHTVKSLVNHFVIPDSKFEMRFLWVDSEFMAPFRIIDQFQPYFIVNLKC